MRKRAVRDLVTIAGVVVVLVGVAFANSEFRRGGAAERFINMRRAIEAQRREGGLDLVPWELLQQTRGTMRTGPTFAERLLPYNDTDVNVVGFMVPLDEFRQMREFLLLPMPLECYFCEAPPMRDVMLIQMAEGKNTDLFHEPVLVNGRLELPEGPNTKFFYVLHEASLGPGKEGDRLRRRDVPLQHRAHQAAERMNEEPLLEGQSTSGNGNATTD